MYKDIKTIRQKLLTYFSSLNLKNATFIITGSISRGNARFSNGKLVSDIDILVVIKKVNDIDEIKPLVSQILYKEHKITFVFTLLDFYKKDLTRGYVRDTSSEDILYDGLNIRDFVMKNNSKLLEKSDMARSIFQELNYYYAKYLCTNDRAALTKVQNSWQSLNKIYGQKVVSCNPTREDIQQYIRHIKIDILASSLFFMQNPLLDSSVLFDTMRNLVFLENQGIPYRLSIVQGGDQADN